MRGGAGGFIKPDCDWVPECRLDLLPAPLAPNWGGGGGAIGLIIIAFTLLAVTEEGGGGGGATRFTEEGPFRSAICFGGGGGFTLGGFGPALELDCELDRCSDDLFAPPLGG